MAQGSAPHSSHVGADGSAVDAQVILMDRKSHWENVYNTRASDQVSWFQVVPTTSLALLEQVGLTAKT